MSRKDVWLVLALASSPALFGIGMALDMLHEGSGLLGVCVGFAWSGALLFLWYEWVKKGPSERPRKSVEDR